MNHHGIRNLVCTTRFARLYSKLTEDEIRSLQSLPFLKNLDTTPQPLTPEQVSLLSVEESKILDRLPKKKREYINKKIATLKPIFRKGSSDMLDYRITDPAYSHVTPFDVESSKRLSVTKLLTKGWCELRKMYDIYAQTDIFKSKRVAEGSKIHSTLEERTHKKTKDVLEIIDSYNIENLLQEFNEKWLELEAGHKLLDVPSAEGEHVEVEEILDLELFAEDIFSQGWCNNVSRLYDLCTNGEAREILVHGYINKSTGKFVEGAIDSKSEDLILISGVIDHIYVPNHPTWDSSYSPLDGNHIDENDDMDATFKDIDVLLNYPPKETEAPWVYHLGDVKTRAYNNVPLQENVVNASKLQVMYYKFFFRNLCTQPREHTFQKLVHNAHYRGLDPYKYLQSEQVFSLFVQFAFFRKDLLKLKDGSIFQDEVLDGGSLQVLTQEANAAPEYDQEKLNYYLQRFFPDWGFEGKWVYWPTLEYFARRMSQLYSRVLSQPNSSISNELSIEYYNKRNMLFQKTEFEYDENYFKQNLESSVAFWLGKRLVEPIDPLVDDNLNTYCKKCEYRNHCFWKFKRMENLQKMSTKSKKLGTMLQEINRSLCES
ncbi:hypothetical protein ACO0RG_002758 [Hanseniaspora osmophila]